MEKKHQLILLSADLRQVHARLARKFNAGMAESERFPRKEKETGLKTCYRPQ